MVKQRFEEWLREEPVGNFFICECRVSRAHFQEMCVPEIRKKFGALEILWIRQGEEWDKKRGELASPSLFPGARVVLLENLEKEKIFQIAQEASQYSKSFFVLLSSPEVLREPFWQKFPWIVVEEDREVFLRFLGEEAVRLGLVFEDDAREALFRLASEYELQRGEIVSFLEELRGNRVTKEEVEAFFTQSEKVLLFRFLDALSERDAPSALRYAYRLMEYRFSPSLLVVHLARRFRLFAQFCANKGTQRDLWQGKEVSSFEARRIEGMKKHFHASAVPEVFAILRTADRFLKTQSIDPYLWCVLLVSKLTQLEKGPD